MKYYRIIIGVAAISSLLTTAYANVNQTAPVLFCPGTSNIVIQMEQGTAKSTDGKWIGQSAIPPQDKDNWRSKIDDVNYDMTGHCQYFIGSIEAVDIQYTDFPPSYHLYDINDGITPLGNCWDIGNYRNTPDEPSSTAGCYFYKNPI